MAPDRLREFYRQQLGLQPDPDTGVTAINRNFLDRILFLAEAERQISAAA